VNNGTAQYFKMFNAHVRIMSNGGSNTQEKSKWTLEADRQRSRCWEHETWIHKCKAWSLNNRNRNVRWSTGHYFTVKQVLFTSCQTSESGWRKFG